MRLPSWLRPFSTHLNPVRKRRARPRLRRRLRLEPLEDRITPSAVMLNDINPTGDGLLIGNHQSAVVNGTAFFAADDGAHGPSLWKTDGTSAGTVLVKNIVPNESELPIAGNSRISSA